VVTGFLAAVAGYYHPGLGFTAFIEFPESGHDTELAAVQAIPHVDHKASGGYDGQFYATLTFDPLLRNPAIDRAVDSVPYRGRRILFVWTAYVLGMGRPAWRLHVFAFQNVVAWLLLAWLLCRWLPPSDGRSFALWAGCLLSPGLLASVRYALPDGPSALLVAAGVALLERGKPLASAMVTSGAALGRETAILAAASYAWLLRRQRRTWVLTAICLVMVAVPLALWFDYLRSIYRATVFEAGSDNLTTPLTALVEKGAMTRREWRRSGLTIDNVLTLTSLLSFFVHAGIVVWAVVRTPRRSPWLFAALPFLMLALFLAQPVWEGAPGAYTRVLLPLTIGANVILATSRASWIVIVLGNLASVPAALTFVRQAAISWQP
jgi:hypothetical protein